MSQRVHRTDEPIATNKRGGQQSAIQHTPRLVPGEALAVLQQRFKNDSGEWRKIPADVHAQAALAEYDTMLNDSNLTHVDAALEHLAKAIATEDAHPNSSAAPYPPEAVLRIAEVTAAGVTKYGENNWRLLEFYSEVDHAMLHLLFYFSQKDDEDHLGHAFCRTAFAVAQKPKKGHNFKKVRRSKRGKIIDVEPTKKPTLDKGETTA